MMNEHTVTHTHIYIVYIHLYSFILRFIHFIYIFQTGQLLGEKADKSQIRKSGRKRSGSGDDANMVPYVHVREKREREKK